MMNHLGLGFVFTVRDLATGRLHQLERAFHTLDQRVGLGAARIDRAFNRLGLGLAVFTAGAATVAGGFGLATIAGRFETSIAQVAAVSGASAAELGQLRDAAVEAGIATQFSPTEAVLGLRELAQVGFSARDSLQLLTPVLDLAAGSLGELSPQAAAGLAAQAMNAFGPSTAEASVSVDRMLQAVNLFALGAGDLPMALGISSRGAQTLHQSLSETLISVGLVRNVVPGLERASTAVAVAMERLANPRTQQMLQHVGVEVVDRATGGFRGFLDVLQELGPALSDMSEAERSAFLLHAFGHHAMTGLSAIMTQVTNGVRTQSGELVRGADAVSYLREQFEHAEGTAERFREQMLSTFDGQMRLLRGSVETLAIVAGQPFAEVFRPIVGAVVDVVNALIAVVRGLPGSFLRGLAAIVTTAGAFVGMVGALVAGQAAIALFTMALEAAGVTLSGLAAALAVPLAAATALGLAFTALRVAFDRNVGGIAGAATRAWSRVRLAFQALSQLFESGELSGEVQRELSRAESSGIRRFVITLYMLGHRVLAVFEGIRSGFVAAVDAAKPALLELQDAFKELGVELEALFTLLTGGARHLPSAEYRSFGASIGSSLGSVLEVLVELVRWGVRFASGFLRGVHDVAEMMKPVLTALGEAFGEIDRQLRAMSGAEKGVEDAAASFDLLRTAGRALAEVIGIAVLLVAASFLAVVMLVRDVIRVVRAAEERWTRFTSAMREVGRAVRRELEPITSTIEAITRASMAVMRGLFDAAAAHVRAVAGAIGAALATVAAQIRGVVALVPPELIPESMRELVAPGTGPTATPAVVPVPPARAPVVQESSSTERTPAAAASARQGAAEASLAAVVRAVASQDRRPGNGAVTPTVITLQVDGETLARVTNEAQGRVAARSFTPVPVY